MFGSYFSGQATTAERLAYVLLALAVLAYSSVTIGAELGLIAPRCDLPSRAEPLKYGNPDYVEDPCKGVRHWSLLGFTTWECSICMRTMSVLCLGACCYCICSLFSFLDGPMAWDASRSSAAIPTGVGFLGGATIWKGKSSSSGREEIHGLTAAILVWLTAAVGNAIGGAMYVPALFTTAAAIVILNTNAIEFITATAASRKRSRDSNSTLQREHHSALTLLALNLITLTALRPPGALAYALLSLAAPYLAPPCDRTVDPSKYTAKYSNPVYAATYDPCFRDRHAILGGLSRFEADLCVRLSVSVLLGAIIGYERKRSDRGALYTFGGIYCEQTGPSSWDTSRVASSVVSGVSFIGGAVIVKGSDKNPHVHGLTTATSVWLSAALGLMAGGALYPVGFFAALTAVFYLRFGPRSYGTAPASLAHSIWEDPKGEEGLKS
ncbi:hypothetical protein EMIHUDRAFT_251383 [Emiliania huxleyi CCMP1516]|uniref:MgtC/SapB/SrpB/YhiD N-terminal domain-containing protein n=2 Tax=Emiliania huxleyi TaxID=2903 RepID=A0A0D3KVI4_EMIH1|nr:hypothetical protein EMIHUDRAFT_251383 [Emiliania huxleyi CCMP1516]EOD39769.1 hypothetical protein EMIHUDRAFT_251383 [Emiliania huxleyi CCMP1516]|eukprot:XP_005792198.1 hypothetical protein EMIHUDRAFT_251383 [Emiliania huxleyi CCMP1516]